METKFKVGDKVKIPNKKSAGNLSLSHILLCLDLSKKYLTINRLLELNAGLEIKFLEAIYGQYFLFSESDLELYEEPKQQNMNKDKTTILSLETAKLMYKSTDEGVKQFALNNFSKEELEAKELPKSWEDFTKNNIIEGYTIYSDDKMIEVPNIQYVKSTSKNKNRYFTDVFPTESLAKASLALSQLLQLRNAWWGDWNPYGAKNVKDIKYSIIYNQDLKDLSVENNYSFNRVFVFETKELAKDFLETFEELLVEAKELI